MEYRIHGPPGCGKTRKVSEWIYRANEKGLKIVATTFTRAAAAELASRVDGLVDGQNVGTLHALCKRHMGGSAKMIDRPSGRREWNEAHPEWALPLSKQVKTSDPWHAPDWLGVASRYRVKLVPLDQWPAEVLGFHKAWTRWKNENNYIDYTDMLEFGAKLTRHPSNPDVLFVDEAQDCTPLQLQIIRRWGAACGYFVLAGDSDQSIYQWAGATPEGFLGGEGEDIHLTQSYRVPQAVHERALAMISRCRKRYVVDYEATGEKGYAASAPFAISDGETLVDEIRGLKNVMILASCGYMLNSVKRELQSREIPYHNPFAGWEWNPNDEPLDESTPILGTIHSVKGGEADHVFLAPDLSSSGQESFIFDPDSMYRLFYVGLTRARSGVVMLAPSSRWIMDW